MTAKRQRQRSSQRSAPALSLGAPLRRALRSGPATWLFVAAVGLWELVPAARHQWTELARRLPEAGPLLVLAAALLFGIGFRHLRLSGLSALGAGLLWALRLLPPSVEGPLTLPLLWALVLGWIALWPVRARLDLRALAGLALAGGSVASHAWWGPAAAEALDRLTPVLDRAAGPAPIALPLLGLLPWVVRALFPRHRRTPLPLAVAWICVSATVLLAQPGTPRAELHRWLLALSTLLVLAEASYRLAYTDELTGLAARRALVDTLARLRGDYAVAVVDIDHFKRFNDRHGHPVGDQVLRLVAAELREVPGCEAFRMGGEEFALVFAGRAVEDAEAEIEAARRRVAARRFVVRGADRARRSSRARTADTAGGARSGARKITVSVGLARSRRDDTSPHAVLDRADRALYRAKRAGRNRLVVAGGR